jgi:ParB-like nuclease domain
VDYSELGLADLKVEAIDPNLCEFDSPFNPEFTGLPLNGIYNVEGAMTDPSTFTGLGHLTQSVTEAGGNYQPGIVRPLGAAPGRYTVVVGTRRCLACKEAGVPFRARVLPADVPADVILRIAVESNSTQRDRTPIQRMNEALELAPVIRARLEAKSKAGVKAVSHETFFGVIADEFFPSNGREYVRQLYAIVLLANGDEESVVYVKAEKDGRDVKKLIRDAKGHVQAIHRNEMTPTRAYKLLDPVKRERKVSSRQAADAEEKERAASTANVLTVAQQVEGLATTLKDAFADKDSRARFLSSLSPDDYTRLAAALPSLIEGLQVIANAATTNAPKPTRRRQRRSMKDSLARLGAAEPDADPRQPWVPATEPQDTEPQDAEPEDTEPQDSDVPVEAEELPEL